MPQEPEAAEDPEAAAAAARAAAALLQAPPPPTIPETLAPLRFTMAASELSYLTQWVLATELRLAGAADAPDALEAATARAGGRVSAALMARGGGGGADDDGDAVAAEPATVELAPAVVLPFQVARLKARLAEKRDWLLRVERAWDDVEARYGAAAAEAAAVSSGGGAAAAEAADGKQQQQEQGEQRQQQQQQQGDQPDHQQQQAGGADGADADADAPPAPGSAAAARAAALARVELQVEEIEALAAKVELAAADAEAAAAALQARFHRGRFALYPHVNSPARLIRALVGRAGAGASVAAVGSPAVAAGGDE